jgi:serine protease Do
MPRQLLKATLLCAVISIPTVAQERVHMPGTGETDEWCVTPIVWTGMGQDGADGARELRAEVEAAARHAYLGVDLGELTDAKANELKLGGQKGALVDRVMPGSPADKAGLKPNDVILSIDGKAIASNDELRSVLETHNAGDEVSIELMRDGKRQKLDATLTGRMGDVGAFAWPNGTELWRGRTPQGWNFGTGEPYVMLFPGAPRLGVSVLPMTDDLRDYFGVNHGSGVLISSVAKGSAAERAGLRAGDVVLTVDGQPVSRAGDISRALAAKDGNAPRTIQVEIVRNHSQQTLSATVDAPRLMNEE